MRLTPLPGAQAPGSPWVAWRIDAQRHAAGWDSGVGAQLAGGRWNPRGVRAVYSSLDPATCILESALHRGFALLDTQPYMLTCIEIPQPAPVHVVQPQDVPNPAWLQAGIVSAGQQAWGGALLAAHAFVAFPSVVSRQSWHLVFSPDVAAGRYVMAAQARLVIDGRLHPPR